MWKALESSLWPPSWHALSPWSPSISLPLTFSHTCPILPFGSWAFWPCALWLQRWILPLSTCSSPSGFMPLGTDSLQAALVDRTISDTCRLWAGVQTEDHNFKYLLHFKNFNKARNYFIKCVQFLASLIAQLVKNLSAMQETPVPFLGREDPLEKG